MTLFPHPALLTELHILHWNCRSIRSKISEFNFHLGLYSPDIVALQETRLYNDKTPNFDKYYPIRLDRTYNNGGGIALYIKDGLKYRVKILQRKNRSKIEAQCITLKVKNNEIDIMNIYIPPNTRLNEAELKYYIRQLSPNFIICGDFNGHHHHWKPRREIRCNTIKILFTVY